MTSPEGIPGIGRRAAQHLARAELSKPVYHPHEPWYASALRAVLRWLDRLFHGVGTALPGGWWMLAGVAVLAVVVAAVVLTWARPVARARRRPRELPQAPRARTSGEYRESARALAAAGDHAGAICECVRAIAAELDERGVLLPRPGRTADEFAREAGLALPGHAAGLRDAALLFDEVRYGRRPGSQPGYERVRDLDTRVRASAGSVARAAAQRVAAQPQPAGARGSAP